MLSGLHVFSGISCPESQLPAEGSVQQRFFQFVERGEFALVEGFEALGFIAYLFPTPEGYQKLAGG